MSPKIRILLVDDHQTVRESWKFLLEKDDRFLVIGESSEGGDAVEKAARLNPDIILMDVNMKPVNGFEATERIISGNPAARIIGLSVNNQHGYAKKLMGLGAKGFVTKSSQFAELVSAILKVYNGETYICEEVRKQSKSRQNS